ncbi:MAG: transposase [Deltaproteobacteria bacterium]|nr:transposase [Deltaproteobacteria bacterium]
MPRGPRLDAPGTLHHVIGRGIERKDIFRGAKDAEDFLVRLGDVKEKCGLQVLAWALLPNHYHLLVRTGLTPLAKAMRRLLTGYVVNYNLRHGRHGHLFQNRYKSIVCDEELYLLELVRYIHLNPYRAGVVKDLRELGRYEWSGHATLMGKKVRPWQETGEILCRFGEGGRKCRRGYEKFVEEGAALGRRPDLTGGGLVRSAGGWSEVLAMRRQKRPEASDQRVLGGGGFVEAVLKEAEKRDRDTLRWRGARCSLEGVIRKVAKVRGVDEKELASGSRREPVIKAREDVAQIAVKKLGMSGADVARRLGVTASCITRITTKGELGPEARKIADEMAK